MRDLGSDGGPSLSTLSSLNKSKRKLKDIIASALEEDPDKGPGRTVVPAPVRHPGCTRSHGSGFVWLVESNTAREISCTYDHIKA